MNDKKKQSYSEWFSEAARVVMDHSDKVQPTLLVGASKIAKEYPTHVLSLAAGMLGAATAQNAAGFNQAVHSASGSVEQWGEKRAQEAANIDGSKLTLYDDHGEPVTHDLATNGQRLDFSLTKTYPPNMTVDEVMAKHREGSIWREMPTQWLGKTVREVEQAQKSGDKSAQKAAKLLNDNRFKDKKVKRISRFQAVLARR